MNLSSNFSSISTTARLELVCIGLWRADGKTLGWLNCLQERIDGLLCCWRDEVQVFQRRHLNQRGLFAIVRLLFKHGDGALQGINRLRIILVCRVVIGFL